MDIITADLVSVYLRFKPLGLINFMVHNHPGRNRERVAIETYKDLNFLIWMGKLTRVEFETGFNSRPG